MPVEGGDELRNQKVSGLLTRIADLIVHVLCWMARGNVADGQERDRQNSAGVFAKTSAKAWRVFTASGKLSTRCYAPLVSNTLCVRVQWHSQPKNFWGEAKFLILG